MGAFLDKPKLEKATEAKAASQMESVVFSICSMQGWRIDMEDSHTLVDSIGEQFPQWSKLRKWAFIAVFDGHAGRLVAEISSKELLPTLLNDEKFPKLYAKLKDDGGDLEVDDETRLLIIEWLKSGFLDLDKSMRDKNSDGSDKERSGTTAVCDDDNSTLFQICAILTPQYVFFANLGDSRGLLCREQNEIIATEDHKPYMERERDRIVKAGGSVMIQRVNGSLAVSRALGDYEYKSVSDLTPQEQLVSPEPDIYICDRMESDQFLVLACDGVFDVFENRELCDLIRSRLQLVRQGDLCGYKIVVEQVLDASLSKGSRDNMTVILCTFSGAPHHSPEAVEEEKRWEEKTKQKIEEFFAEVGDKQEIEADQITSKLIHDSDFAPDKTKGIPRVHLARTLVHKMIGEREKKTGLLGDASIDGDEDAECIRSTALVTTASGVESVIGTAAACNEADVLETD